MVRDGGGEGETARKSCNCYRRYLSSVAPNGKVYSAYSSAFEAEAEVSRLEEQLFADREALREVDAAIQ